MSRPTTEPQLAGEVARIKRAALQYNTRINRSLAAVLIAGVVVGVGVWFLQRPIDRDEVHFSLAAGLGLAIFVLGGLVCRMMFRRPRAECPQCDCDWNNESENNIQTWLNWHCCPGCGLKMRAGADLTEKPNQPLGNTT